MKADLWDGDLSKARKALDAARVANAEKIIPFRVNRNTIVFVSERQAGNTKKMARIIKELDH